MNAGILRTGVAAAVAIVALSASSTWAGTVTVNSTGSIWLAGQPSGAVVSGYFGSDTAPDESPVEIAVTSPEFTFSATGSTSVDGSNYGGPNGAAAYPTQSLFSPSPWSDDYNGPGSALLGVFLDDTTPTLSSANGGAGPDFVAGADYTMPGSTGPGVYAPALNQIFIIGDGSGETFETPTGATRLYLASADSLGASFNNTGSFSVSFNEAVSAAPEPATWATMLLGVALVGGMLRQAQVARHKIFKTKNGGRANV